MTRNSDAFPVGGTQRMGPIIGPDVDARGAAWIDPSAVLYGEVRLEEGTSIWCNAVIRAEHERVVIGERTNIQDFVLIHVGYTEGVSIGRHCSITHHCTLHGCRIGDNVLVGIGSTIMDGCEIGDNSIIAGHTFVKEGTIVPPNSIVMGSPGRVVRTKDNTVANRLNAFWYWRNAQAYARGDYRMSAHPSFAAEMEEEQKRLEQAFGMARQVGD